MERLARNFISITISPFQFDPRIYLEFREVGAFLHQPYSFNYFEPSYHTNYYTAARFRIRSRTVELASIWKALGIQFLVNLDNRYPFMRFVRKLWEQHLCFVLRGKQLTFVLEADKPEWPAPDQQSP